MKKLLLTIFGPVLLVGATVVGIVWWDRGALPGFQPPVVDVSVEDVTRDHRGVRIKGTAHYELRINQVEGNREYIVYPLMARGDTSGQTIHALVRTTRLPDRIISFEDVTVEGLARPPGRLINRPIVEALLSNGYNFEEDFVLILEFEGEDEDED
ncbi:MAG: hypothetical protein ACI8S6_005936, partial [Myxococcota bacterium]